MNPEKPKKNPEDRHPFIDQLSQLWRNKTAVAGLIIITIFILCGILAPYISPHDPLETSLYPGSHWPSPSLASAWPFSLGPCSAAYPAITKALWTASSCASWT
jgi:peptide/nickel transport system permease protein/dipeptide transport system permease protein